MASTPAPRAARRASAPLIILCAGLFAAALLAGCAPSKHVVKGPTPPTATATPSLDGQMVFGGAMKKNSDGSLSIVNQTSAFSKGDPFTYLVSLRSPIGENGMGMRLYDTDASGAWHKLVSWLVTADQPDWGQFSQSYTTIEDMMPWCSGTRFKLEMEAGSTVVASATFTYTGCGDSSSPTP